MSFLITPNKLHPFTALISPSNCHRSISPPPDINISVNSTPLPGSSGMFLLIHNILPDNKTGFANPIELVKRAINKIMSCDKGKELADIAVEIIHGGQPQDPHCSSAYIELAQQIKTLDTIPQPNLLINWMNVLCEAQPLWEVVWAPQKKGKDCRMVIHFHVTETKEKVPTRAADRIHAHLESKGHRTTRGYISFNGLVNVMLTDMLSVNSILASHYYSIPSLSKEGIHVSPPQSHCHQQPL
jgi:hypothetical protein